MLIIRYDLLRIAITAIHDCTKSNKKQNKNNPNYMNSPNVPEQSATHYGLCTKTFKVGNIHSVLVTGKDIDYFEAYATLFQCFRISVTHWQYSQPFKAPVKIKNVLIFSAGLISYI